MDHENLSCHMEALTIDFEETDIGVLARRAHARLETILFLRELHNLDFAEDGTSNWADQLTRIVDALDIRSILADMLAAGSD